MVNLPSRNGTEAGDRSEIAKVGMPDDLTDLAKTHSKILFFVLPLQSKPLQVVDIAMASDRPLQVVFHQARG